MYKFFATIILAFLLLNGVSAQVKKKKPKKTKPIENQKVISQDSADSFQVLALGKDSKVDKPFIFVARDKETYKLLQNLVEKLPDTIDFEKNAVVAFFVQLPNPCHTFSVNKNSDSKIVVNFISPQMRVACRETINLAHKVVLVPIEEDKPLKIETNESWLAQVKNYQITSSNFNYFGGFAGLSEDFEVEGNIGVTQFGDYVSFIFNLNGKGENKQRILTEISSGILKNSEIKLNRLNAGTFADNPKPPVKVLGKLSKKLSLKFEPLPTNVNDGFAVRGTLEATLK